MVPAQLPPTSPWTPALARLQDGCCRWHGPRERHVHPPGVTFKVAMSTDIGVGICYQSTDGWRAPMFLHIAGACCYGSPSWCRHVGACGAPVLGDGSSGRVLPSGVVIEDKSHVDAITDSVFLWRVSPDLPWMLWLNQWVSWMKG